MAKREFAEGRWTVLSFVTREPIKVAPGVTHPNTASCERCFQSIRHVVTLRQENTGAMLSVGQDCALTLEGGPELAEIRAAEAAFRRSEYERMYGERDRAMAAQLKAEKEARRAANAARFASEIETLRAYAALANTSDWARGNAHRVEVDLLDTCRKEAADALDKKSFEFIASARRSVAVGAGGHIAGEVGQRVTVTATLHAVIPPNRETCGQYPTWLAIFHTTEGAVMQWRASGGLFHPDTPDGYAGKAVQPGETVTVVATIKAHGEYRGIKNTSVSRVAMAKPAKVKVAKPRAKKKAPEVTAE